MSFSKNGFFITPFGAAIVEAMPDKKLMTKIKHDFKRTGYVPASALFAEVPRADTHHQDKG